MSSSTVLPEGCEIRSLSWNEFAPLYNLNAKKIFENSQIFRFHQHDEEIKTSLGL